MNTTLVIMAAGIGSRFGTGIKQLAKMGEGNEIIMDYSIFDAKEAGFNKVVFIIRKDIEKEFKEVIGNRIEKHITCEYVFQDLHDIPEGFSVPENRTKPWGTGQAVLCTKGIVKEPFVVINADDYYGKEAFQKLHDFLVNNQEGKDIHKLAMAGFVLKNTLSENGTVTRGICVENAERKLEEVLETRNIEYKDGVVSGTYRGDPRTLDLENLCSMNMWAAYPEFLDSLEKGFTEFFETCPTLETKEFLLPSFINRKVHEGEVEVSVLKTNDKWIGVTYREDMPLAQAKFKELIEQGVYSSNLWND
ncbi:MAG: sugar phosphate nucleotidyltransferase [Bacillota bacterium]|nr:sugar phosphate nucleotidyltransferase [Bacillota bacterium]